MPDTARSIKDRVSAAEWQTRVDLAACCRLVDLYGMSDMLGNNVTARVPGEGDHWLINPLGLLHEEVTASSVVKIDMAGNIVLDSLPPYEVNQAGVVIHGAMHRARADVDCVIHTHTPAGMTVSALECGILPLVQSAMRFGAVAYHDFNGLSLDLAEQQGLMADLGDADVMILRNHGLLAMGSSIAAAFDAIYRLELVCKVQVAALSCNAKLRRLPEALVAETQAIYKSHVIPRAGRLEWPALLRKLDRIDSSYRN
jgi:ribulose-5-phosphate 4-epimerase/fuculose-1-phosphate aldolase